jgi:hypothetical protein
MRNQARKSACWAQQGIAGESVSDLLTGIAVLLRSELQAGALGLRKQFERNGIASEKSLSYCEFDIAEAEGVGFRACRGRGVCLSRSAEPEETHECKVAGGTIEWRRAGIEAELAKDGH